jgi:hypothetical protein
MCRSNATKGERVKYFRMRQNHVVMTTRVYRSSALLEAL